MRAEVEEVFGGRRSDAEAMPAEFSAFTTDQVDLHGGWTKEPRCSPHNAAPGAAEYIAYEENSQYTSLPVTK